MFIKHNHDVFFDVIIVGAGLSGLRTAYELIYVHKVDRSKILIVDAQDYIGGRVRQADDFVSNGLIELGAEILHGEQTLLTEFAKEHGETIKPIYCWAHGDGGPMEEPVDGCYGLYHLADSQRLLRFDTNDKDFQHLNTVLRKLPQLLPSEIDTHTSLQDFLTEHQCTSEMLRLGRAGYANTSCGNLNTLSLRQVVTFSRQWDTEGEGDGDFKYTNTFRCLLDFFKSQLQDRILLNCPIATVVRCVHDDLCNNDDINGNNHKDNVRASSSVRLEAKDGRIFTAKTAVITASVHVLQRSELLSFQPPLPLRYAQSLSHATMHRAMKIFVQFSEACWPVGLQGMIMAPPAEEEEEEGEVVVLDLEGEDIEGAKKKKSKKPYYHIPECWFSIVPCAEHARTCYGSEVPVEKRHHVVGGCQQCSFYAVGFVTSKFADALDSLEEDADICDLLVSQLDKVFGLLRPRHWLMREQHALQHALVEQKLQEEDQRNVHPPSDDLSASSSSSSSASSSPAISSSPVLETLSVSTTLAAAVDGVLEGNQKKEVEEEEEEKMMKTATSTTTSSESDFSEDGGRCFDDEEEDEEEDEGIEGGAGRRRENEILSLPSHVFVKGRVQRWTPGRHPYTGGGYASAITTAECTSTQEVNSEGNPYDLFEYGKIWSEKPLDNLLFFAGEGVNYPAGGTAHAALESGVRVARLLHETLSSLDDSSAADAVAASVSSSVEVPVMQTFNKLRVVEHNNNHEMVLEQK